jgi:hypothetical protein
MKQADFRMLKPEIQQMYDQYLAIHEGEIARKEQAKQQAEQGYIPTDGALITVQMQVPDKTSPSGTRQVRLPHAALQWLLQKLDGQGQSLQNLEEMNAGVVAEMAQKYFGGGQQQMLQSPQGNPGLPTLQQ